MDRTTILPDAEGIDGQPIDRDELRARLRRRAERRRQHFSDRWDVAVFQQLLSALGKLQVERPTLAAVAEYHYLSEASARSIAMATGRTEAQSSVELRMARAWVNRETKGVIA